MKLKLTTVVPLLLLSCATFISADSHASTNSKMARQRARERDLMLHITTDKEVPHLLLASTIDGSLHALNLETGVEMWSFEPNEPLVTTTVKVSGPVFVPDVADGTLYYYNNVTLQKMPATIQDLVESSPYRGSDGAMYIGHKRSRLFAIDGFSGEVYKEFSDKDPAACPVSEAILYIGRIDYDVTVLDRQGQPTWSVVYSQYTSVTTEENENPVYRYTSLRDGRVQVNNVRTGQHWYIEYPEPVIALYTTQHGSLVKEEINEETAAPTGGSEVGLTRDVTVGVYRGSIYSLPRGVEAQFLALVAEESDCQVGEVGCKPGKYTIQMEEKQTGLVPIGCRPGRASFPACLVGSHSIESVQSSTLAQSESTDDQVLGGNTDDAFVSPQRPTPVPTPSAIPSPVVSEVPILAFVGVALSAMTGTFLALLAGFLVWRKIMKKPQVKRTLSDTSWTSSTGDDIPSHISKSNGYTSSAESSFSKYDTSPSTSMSKYDRSPAVSSSKFDRSPEVSLDKYNESSAGSITTKIGRRESNGIDKQLLETDAAGRVLSREVSVADGAEGVRLQGKKLPETESSQSIVKATDSDSTDNVPDDWESLAEPDSLHPAASVTLESLERSGPIQRRQTSSSEEPYRVGNLVVNPNGVLGHGAQGTMVYTGFFDRRPVAVKRLLAEYFELANMEVDLLQQSDSHANVIRYFCKEQDTQFLYIALELCKGSLADVVSRKFDTGLTNKDIMKDMMNGLVHLHSLNIVHRDIKPGNVLVSSENRILISDFGLCKRLPDDKSSYATQVSGTQGWIAPEFLIHGRMTRAVDIFAAGCVLFYLVSEGCHPFGRPFEREMNIRNNKPDLFVLEGHYEIYDLVKNMLQFNPSERPSAKLVLRHPFFWNADTCLQFLSDVSDRFEKVDKADPALLHIETNAHTVVGADWHKRLDRLLIADLRKFRTYRGDSVRDLMRVMRNKKNHYQELSPELKVAIGKVPIGYYEYFRSRFPNLVLHVFKFMLDSGEYNDYRFHRYFGSEG